MSKKYNYLEKDSSLSIFERKRKHYDPIHWRAKTREFPAILPPPLSVRDHKTVVHTCGAITMTKEEG